MKELQERRLVIGKSVKRVTLQRFLCSKIVIEPEEVKERDLWAIYQNQVFLQAKALREKDFSKNFAKSLELVAIAIKQVNLSKGLNKGAILNLAIKLKTSCPEFLYPMRNYSSIKSKVGDHYHIIFTKSEGLTKSELPPTRYIGVGYKDKGSARNEAEDASPNWKDVASRAAYLQRRLREILDDLSNQKDRTFKERRELHKLFLSFKRELDRLRRDPRRSKRTSEEDSSKAQKVMIST